jgi:PAS domain S-box-containing protein
MGKDSNFFEHRKHSLSPKLDISNPISESKLVSHTLNSVEESILLTDMQERIIYANKSFLDLYGYTLCEIIGKPITEIRATENDPNIIKQIIPTSMKEGWRGRLWNKKKNGEKFLIDLYTTVVKDDLGVPYAYLGVARNITQAVQSENRLEELIKQLEDTNKKLKESQDELLQVNSMKDKLFSIIAHDLRSPFGALISITQYLADDIEEFSKKEVKEFVQRINQSTKNVFVLLENLLHWSKIQSGNLTSNPVAFDIAYKIDDVTKLLCNIAENKNISVKNEVSADTYVYADEDMIFSVLQNLFSNAIKFTRPGGHISFAAFIKEKVVEISVHDNGIGIPEEIIPKLFDSHYHRTTPGTNEEKGSGFGLVLCNEIMNMNNGKIWVNSNTNKGSTFTFLLPRPAELQ